MSRSSAEGALPARLAETLELIGSLDFHFAVDNPLGLSAKAFAVVLGDALSGEPLERVAAVPAAVVERLFGRELSMGKNLGLTGMLQFVQREARRRLAPAGA